MEEISEEIWKKILNRQNFPLIGTIEPNNGNGYHDGLSWYTPFVKERENESFNEFRTIYLRDLSNELHSIFRSKNKFVEALDIKECSENYKKTFEKYISVDEFQRNKISYQLGDWGRYLGYKGRLIFEIVGWQDNNTNQFYAFELKRLDTDYCKLRSNHITYNAPFEQKGDKIIFRKVRIPKYKCIVIDFPNEFGGYKGFINKDKQVLSLGNRYKFDINPQNLQKNYESNIEWDKKYHKIIADWGTSPFTTIDDVSEFYKELNFFKYRYLVICCTHEIINGLKQLIDYLNRKLLENAEVEFKVKEYDKDYFKSMKNKFVAGELSFKEANEFLKFYH